MDRAQNRETLLVIHANMMTRPSLELDVAPPQSFIDDRLCLGGNDLLMEHVLKAIGASASLLALVLPLKPADIGPVL